MKIIIVGSGSVGSALAEHLCSQRHDVIVIDQDHSKVEIIKQKIDVMAVCGNGASPKLLQEVGTKKADLFVAVTDDDEINILAALAAEKFDVKRKIVRVKNRDYFDERYGFDQAQLKVDVVINPDTLCAEEICRLLYEREVFEIIQGDTEHVRIIGINVAEDSRLVGMSTSAVVRELNDYPLCFVAVCRHEETLIPHGDFVFQGRDKVYVLGAQEAITAFQDWMGFQKKAVHRVIIGGVNDLSIQVARRLEAEGVQVRLMCETDREAQAASVELRKTIVLQGSMTSVTYLKEAGISNCSAFLALSEDDENNILSCILANKYGAEKTFSRIAKIEYIPIVANISSIHSIVSTRLTALNAIMNYMPSGEVVAARGLQEINANVMEVLISSHSRMHGTAIKDLDFPQEAIIGAIIRGNHVIVPSGGLVLQENDRVVVVALPSCINKIERIFSNKVLGLF